MSAAAWGIIGYVVIDRIITVGMVGRSIPITPASAVLSLITGGILVWAALVLEGVV